MNENIPSTIPDKLDKHTGVIVAAFIEADRQEGRIAAARHLAEVLTPIMWAEGMNPGEFNAGIRQIKSQLEPKNQQ